LTLICSGSSLLGAICQTLAWLRRFALSLLKQHPDTKKSLVMKRRLAGWSTTFLSEVLFEVPS
jgi:hypothetical protein